MNRANIIKMVDFFESMGFNLLEMKEIPSKENNLHFIGMSTETSFPELRLRLIPFKESEIDALLESRE